MRRLSIPNLFFFCFIGFMGDCLNFIAIQAEIFLADSVFHGSERQLGLLGACASLGYALPAFGAGMLSEKLGRRPLCLFGVGGLLLCYLATPYAASVNQVCLISLLRSGFTAFVWPPLMAWMAKAEDFSNLSGFLGCYNISWAGGILAGFYFSGILFTYGGTYTPFYAAAILALILFLFIACCQPKGGHGLAGEGPEPSHGMHASDVWHFVRQGLLMMTLGTLLASMLMYVFPKLAGPTVDERGQSVLNAIRMAGQVLAFIVFGWTTHWHFRRWPMALCAGCLAAGTVTVAMANIYIVYAVGFALVGFGFGIAFMLSAYYALGLIASKGRSSGIMETLIGGGGVAGPLAGGIVAAQFSPRTAVLSGLIPIVVISALAARKRKG